MPTKNAIRNDGPKGLCEPQARAKRQHTLRPVLLLSILLGLSSAVLSEDTQEVNDRQPVLRLPPASKTPVIDGVINDDEWAGAWMMEGSTGSGDQALDERRAWAYITYDKHNLYVAIKSDTRPGGELYMWEHDPAEAIMSQDGIELWVAALEDPSQPPIDKFQIWFDPYGTQFAMVTRYGAGFKVKDELTRSSKIHGDEWHIEVAFPWKLAGLSPADIVDGRHILVRPCRNWRGNLIYTSWGGKGAFYQMDNMMRLILDSKAPVVRIPDLGKPFDGKLAMKVEVANPGKKAAKLNAKVSVVHLPQTREAKAEGVFTREQKLEVAAGATRAITLSGTFDAPPLLPKAQQHAQRRTLHYRLRVDITRADTGETVYKRVMYLPGRRNTLWSKLPERKTKLAGGYYPYEGKVRATLELGDHPRAKEITRAEIALSAADSGKTLGRGIIKGFRYNKGTTIFAAGDLKNGKYILAATLFAGDKKVATAAPVTRSFTREKQAWEHNKIGKSNRVYPPFIPIKVKGRTVSCVLREHKMNGLGFWDQVVAKGKPILAGPMRLECRSGGKMLRWRVSKRPRFSKKAGHETRLEGKGSCAVLRVKTKCLWEYDGMLKVNLELVPAGSGQVDELELVIPVKKEIATLLHSTTMTRSNPSMALPAKQGVIWDSSTMVQTIGKGTFTPYVWIGGVERGVCWFADNDRGWITDDTEAAIEVERAGDAVNLRVRFINRPGIVKGPRKIVFGLMATPVKPIPAASRAWGHLKGAPRSYSTSLSSWRFAGFSSGETLTPMGNDFSIFEFFAKHQGTRKTPKTYHDDIHKWMLKYRKDPKRRGLQAQLEKTFRNTVNTDEAVYYTNPALESTRTPQGIQFANEWKGGVSGMGCNFVDSYNDYAAWAYDSMLKSGLKCHVYQDNTFPVGSTDLVAGSAYVREDGRIQCGWNIFGHREFYKRLFVVGWERMGRMPLTYPHSTNGMCIPQFSFATIHLALEWQQHGTRSFQEKFPFALLRTEVMGKQAGLIPRILCGMGPKAGGRLTPEQRAQKARLTARLTRTREGVLLLHDAYVRGHGKYFGDVVRMLMRYGFHQESCSFVGYWEKPKGVTAPDGVSISLFKMDKSVLAVVVDISGKPGVRKISVDRKKLGRALTQKRITDFEKTCVSEYGKKDSALYDRYYTQDYRYNKLKCYNLNNGFKAVDDSTVEFKLRKHDYCLLLIE